METKNTGDVHVADYRDLPTPHTLLEELPRTAAQADKIAAYREEIEQIIFGGDPRLLAVVGPCSIHDVEAGREYAEKLAELAERLRDRVFLVMRVYFEKPRTTTGWKGLIMDPQLDGSADLPTGLRVARKFLGEVLDLGLPTATELLDPITPQYIADLICWSAIGARTTESQTHRQMASGLSMPLGFKNGTDGDLAVAINAIKAASAPQTFLGINGDGQAAAVSTRGNPNCHIVLRGGRHGPNFDIQNVRLARQALEVAKLPPAVMIDCSHANSAKDPSFQPEVLRYGLGLVRRREPGVIGFMLESNLKPGKQPFPRPKEELEYGVSITDGCIGWDATEALLTEAAEAVQV
ncbi:MAG: 3-deoxy-7-phosphoheptulonate synthase [Opitutales bacterium]